MSFSRRDVLKLAGATLAAGAVPLGAAGRSTSIPAAPGRTRNVILLVADGMSAGVPTLAEPFSQLVRGRGTHWAAMARSRATVHGLADTAALDSLVPDSAAAASAWGSGSRVNNGSINMLPDGTPLVPIGHLARATGRRVGLVSTTRITDATPAGFAAVVPSRTLEQDIAQQYLGEVDVLLGGGRSQFDDALRTRFQQHGYAMYESREELTRARGFGEKMLGLFAPSYFPYCIDAPAGDHAARATPNLAEMSRAALMSLSGHDGGFLLQIEGGRVDHAAHGTDAAAILWEQFDFDDAIGVVLEFIADRDDTLVIVTTDHANANPGLNGIGAGYRGSTVAFERLARFDASFSTMERRISNAANDQDAQQIVEHVTGIAIERDHAALLRRLTDGQPVDEMNHQLATFRGQLAQMLGNVTGVMFTGRTHTADWVLSMATGPGSERFSGLQANTQVFAHIAELMGINHRNPVGTEQPKRRGVIR